MQHIFRRNVLQPRGLRLPALSPGETSARARVATSVRRTPSIARLVHESCLVISHRFVWIAGITVLAIAAPDVGISLADGLDHLLSAREVTSSAPNAAAVQQEKFGNFQWTAEYARAERQREGASGAVALGAILIMAGASALLPIWTAAVMQPRRRGGYRSEPAGTRTMLNQLAGAMLLGGLPRLGVGLVVWLCALAPFVAMQSGLLPQFIAATDLGALRHAHTFVADASYVFVNACLVAFGAVYEARLFKAQVAR